MTKKLLAIFIALVLAIVTLVSCGDDKEINNSSDDNLDANTKEEDYDLIIAYCALKGQENIGEEFAEENDLKIKYIRYDYDNNLNALDVMLMAQNTEVDIFYSSVLDTAKYVRMGYFEDLNQYEALKTRIDSNTLVDYISDYDGKCFGVPSYSRYDDKEMYMYTSPAFLTYCFENIDGFAGTYQDPDGEKLYEVFKYMYEHDGDVVELPLEEVDYKVADCSGYYMMSPFSKHKDTAALFLEYMFDSFKDQQFPKPYYPDLGDIDFEGTYLTWRSSHYQVCEPLYIAINEKLMNTDGSEKALRKLAKETARQVRMRLEG